MSNPIDEVKFLVGKHGIAGAYEHLESDAKFPEERMYQNFRRECKRYLDGYVAGLRLVLPALDQLLHNVVDPAVVAKSASIPLVTAAEVLGFYNFISKEVANAPVYR
jgi:hypothetical protein